MTKREYIWYHQEMYDRYKKRINIGDLVVMNSTYGPFPIIGIVDHFTESKNVAVYYKLTPNSNKEYKYYAYRAPYNLIKLADGNNYNT